MRRSPSLAVLSALMMAGIMCGVGATNNAKPYDGSPPFGLGKLQPITFKPEHAGVGETTIYGPKKPYNIFINYELGMHCVGFDISYCCIIPPYNSVQAQAVRSASGSDGKPVLLSPGNEVQLHYAIKDNSYSEGNKMKYWAVPKDASGAGTMANPDDNMANYVWNHLFIYKDLQGTLPDNPQKAQRRYVGKQIPVNIDSGPTGRGVAGGYMDYAREKGGNIVFTDSMLPELKNVPLVLTASYLWDALGLPRTAFNDSRRRGSIRNHNGCRFPAISICIGSTGGQQGAIRAGKRQTRGVFRNRAHRHFDLFHLPLRPGNCGQSGKGCGNVAL